MNRVDVLIFKAFKFIVDEFNVRGVSTAYLRLLNAFFLCSSVVVGSALLVFFEYGGPISNVVLVTCSIVSIVFLTAQRLAYNHCCNKSDEQSWLNKVQFYKIMSFMGSVRTGSLSCFWISFLLEVRDFHIENLGIIFVWILFISSLYLDSCE